MKININTVIPRAVYEEIIQNIKDHKPFEKKFVFGGTVFTIHGEECDNGPWEDDYYTGISTDTAKAGCSSPFQWKEILKVINTYEAFLNLVKYNVGRYEKEIIFEEDMQISMF